MAVSLVKHRLSSTEERNLKRLCGTIAHDLFGKTRCLHPCNQPAPKICLHCRLAGHVRRDCPELAAIQCYQCKGYDHLHRHCQKQRVDEVETDTRQEQELMEYNHQEENSHISTRNSAELEEADASDQQVQDQEDEMRLVTEEPHPTLADIDMDDMENMEDMEDMEASTIESTTQLISQMPDNMQPMVSRSEAMPLSPQKPQSKRRKLPGIGPQSASIEKSKGINTKQMKRYQYRNDRKESQPHFDQTMSSNKIKIANPEHTGHTRYHQKAKDNSKLPCKYLRSADDQSTYYVYRISLPCTQTLPSPTRIYGRYSGSTYSHYFP